MPNCVLATFTVWPPVNLRSPKRTYCAPSLHTIHFSVGSILQCPGLAPKPERLEARSGYSHGEIGELTHTFSEGCSILLVWQKRHQPFCRPQSSSWNESNND
jgi:hypothetical protein